MTNDNRVPAGSPEGGQFATGAHPESVTASLGSHDDDAYEADVALARTVIEQVESRYGRRDSDPGERIAELDAYLDDGGRLRDSTREALHRCTLRGAESLDHLRASMLIRRDVDYAGREHLLDRALTDNPHRKRGGFFEFEDEFDLTDEDMAEVKRNPSTELVHMLKTMDEQPHVRWDRNVADMAHRQAQWNAAKRTYGSADISDLPEVVRRTKTEDMAGVSVMSVGFGRSMLAVSPERNAKIPKRFRREDGRYYGDIGHRAVYRTFPGEAVYHARWYPGDHKKIPRANADYEREMAQAKAEFDQGTREIEST